MAEKKPSDSKTQKSQSPGAADERLFTVPLRKEWLRVPLNKRAKRSVKTVRSFLSRHMKIPDTDIKISAKLNDAIWKRGAGKPPSKVRIKSSFDAKEGTLFARLPDEKPPEKEAKKTKKKPEEKAASVKEAVEKAVQKAGTAEEVKKAADEIATAEKAKEAGNPAREKKKTEPGADSKKK
jgi:large subunit ribosomal protein L31e